MIDILLMILLIYESVLDIRKKQVNVIPMAIVSAIGIVYNLSSNTISIRSMLTGLMLGVFLVLCSFLTRQKIGFGDGLLFVTMGVCIGGEKCIMIIWSSMLVVAIFGLILMIKNNRKLNMQLPFTPFVASLYAVFSCIWTWI